MRQASFGKRKQPVHSRSLHGKRIPAFNPWPCYLTRVAFPPILQQPRTRRMAVQLPTVNDIAALATDNKFVMTSKAEQKTIAPGITEDAAKTGTSEAQNVFSFDVERVVAQGLVAKDATLEENTADGKGKVDLTDIKYTAINGAAKTYLFRNHAGKRTIGDADGLYEALYQPLMDIAILRRPKSRKVQLKKI